MKEYRMYVDLNRREISYVRSLLWPDIASRLPDRVALTWLEIIPTKYLEVYV